MRPIDLPPLTKFAALALLAAALPLAGAPPAPVITAISLEGTAPFAVHAHAIGSDPGAGDLLTAEFLWQFGDPYDPRPPLAGWNAAHVYDVAGTYTMTLRLTNDAGESASAHATVTVHTDDRDRVYAASDGDDDADGATPESAVRTFARAIVLADDSTAVLFRRGDVFEVASSGEIACSACLFGAWGSGERPVLRWTGAPGFGHILGLDPGASGEVVLQDLHFDSIHADFTGRDIASALRPAGENVTVRRSSFVDLTNAIDASRAPSGLLTMENGATSLRAYYLWGEGSDHVHLDCTVDGSAFEHDMRLAGVERANIAGCTLANEPKRTIWAMSGDWLYLSGNALEEGRLTVGPSHVSGSPAARLRWCVVERTSIAMSANLPAIEVNAGAEHVAIRNNVLHSQSGTSVMVMGYVPAMDRTSRDVRLLHNTAVLAAIGGRFLDCGAGTDGVIVAGNLYVAPELRTGDYRRAILFILGEDLGGFEIAHNVWPIPAGFDWVPDGYHYLWPYWANAGGYQNPAEWALLPEIESDVYASIVLDDSNRPEQGLTTAGEVPPRPGIFDDFLGARRPPGLRTAGAVELSPVSLSSTGLSDSGASLPLDIDGDGEISSTDLLRLLLDSP